MSFWDALSSIAKNFEKTVEKNSSKAVNDPDEGQQAERDAQNAGGNAANTAGDEANEQVENREPAWKAVKDLSDKAIDAENKAIPAAKFGWLKFVGVVTALFSGAILFASTQTGISPEQQAARDTLRQVRDTQRQLEYLNQIVLSQEDWNTMMGGLEVPLKLTPVVPSTAPVAAPSPPPRAVPAPLPPVIAAVAAEPIEVDVTSTAADGETSTRTFTTTVEQVYRNVPDRVRSVMTQPDPPPKIDHGYDHPDPNDCKVRHCMSGDRNKAGGFHQDFTVSTDFASAHIHN